MTPQILYALGFGTMLAAMAAPPVIFWMFILRPAAARLAWRRIAAGASLVFGAGAFLCFAAGVLGYH